MSAQPEERLVLLAQAGDSAAFDQLLRRHERALFKHVFRMMGDEEAAYEALQDTWLAIVRSVRKLRSRSAFRAWAFGVATRVCLKRLSRRKGWRETGGLPVEAPDVSSPLPDAMAAARERMEALSEELLLLTPKLRSVILLHFFEALTLKEVAAALEISIGTVKSRLSAGLARLRARESEG